MKDTDMTERMHTAALVEPRGELRRDRRARRRTAAKIEADVQKTKTLAGRTCWHAERDEARSGACLPKAGDTGPAQLRTPGLLKLPKHQDTTATLSGRYPFLAEAGLGSAGVFVGQDLYSGGSFVYDPWVLYQRGLITAPNIVLAGIVGSGKSSLAKSLYTRSLPFGRRVYVPGDPKGEHTAGWRGYRRQGHHPRPRSAQPAQPAKRRPPGGVRFGRRVVDAASGQASQPDRCPRRNSA